MQTGNHGRGRTGASARGKSASVVLSTTLAALRDRAGLTQGELAEKLGVRQGNISKIEARGDMRIKTLRNYLAAVGGALELRAIVGADVFVIDIFETRGLKRARQAAPSGNLVIKSRQVATKA